MEPIRPLHLRQTHPRYLMTQTQLAISFDEPRLPVMEVSPPTRTKIQEAYWTVTANWNLRKSALSTQRPRHQMRMEVTRPLAAEAPVALGQVVFGQVVFGQVAWGPCPVMARGSARLPSVENRPAPVARDSVL